MKKRIASISIVLLLVIAGILSACGATNTKDTFEMATSSIATSPDLNLENPTPSEPRELASLEKQKSFTAGANKSILSSSKSTGNTQPNQPKKIIKNGTLSLETKEFDTTIPSIIKLVENAGGYIENQTIDGISLYERSNYYERTGNLVARIPAEKLNEVTSAIGNTYNIVSQTEYVNDISDQYYDAAAHLDMLKAQEKRLLALLEKAEKLEDIIKLEEALTDCRYQIESLTGQLRRMDSQVTYSTLTVNIQEVSKYNDITTPPKTFADKIADAFKRSGKNIAYTLENGLFFIIEELPTLLITLTVGAFIIFIAYKIIKFVLDKYHQKCKRVPNSKPDKHTDSINKE